MVKPRSRRGRVQETERRLKAEYPEAVCELDFNTSFQLLIATILSAQSTDKGVNAVTGKLFDRFPTAELLAEALPGEVEKIIGSLGLFRNKTKNIIRCSQQIVSMFGGEVPHSITDLVSLAGVGRKTANVVRSVALGLPGLPVDTHVLRLSKLLDLTDEKDPVKVELALNPMIKASARGEFSLRIILHGRRVCVARRPKCEACVLADFCPSVR